MTNKTWHKLSLPRDRDSWKPPVPRHLQRVIGNSCGLPKDLSYDMTNDTTWSRSGLAMDGFQKGQIVLDIW